MLLKKATGRYRKLFDLLAYRVLIEKRAGDLGPTTEATLRLRVGEEEMLTVAEGNGPVDALDGALRSGLLRFYPELSQIRLTDFKVRVVTAGEGTAAKVRTSSNPPASMVRSGAPSASPRTSSKRPGKRSSMP